MTESRDRAAGGQHPAVTGGGRRRQDVRAGVPGRRADHDRVPASRFAPLTTVPGWGVVRAAKYGAAVGGPESWPGPRQLFRAAGLSPMQYESAGKRRDGGISREGSVTLRRALIYIGIGLRHNDPAARHYAARAPTASATRAGPPGRAVVPGKRRTRRKRPIPGSRAGPPLPAREGPHEGPLPSGNVDQGPSRRRLRLFQPGGGSLGGASLGAARPRWLRGPASEGCAQETFSVVVALSPAAWSASAALSTR